MGGTALPREEHTNRLFRAKWSVLKAYTELTLNGRSRLHLGICVYVHIYTHTNTYMHTITTDEKEAMTLKEYKRRFEGKKTEML